MKAFVAVKGFTYQISVPTVVCNISFSDIPNENSKFLIDGKKAIMDGYIATVSNVINGIATIPDPVTYTSPFNATKVKVVDSGKKFVCQGDETTSITAIPRIPNVDGSTPAPVTFTIKITSAGQDKVTIDE